MNLNCVPPDLFLFFKKPILSSKFLIKSLAIKIGPTGNGVTAVDGIKDATLT